MSGGDAPRSVGRRPGGLAAWVMAPDFFRDQEVTTRDWVEAVFEPAALVLLVGLFVGGVTRFLQALAPEWDPRLLVPLALVVSLEAFLYGRRLARSTFRPKEWAVLLVPPAILLKSLHYLLGTADVRADVAQWLASPWSFFTIDYIVGLLLLYLAWQMTLDATLELGFLRVQRGEIPDEGDPRRYTRYDADDSSWRHFDHAAPYRNLSARVLWGGVVLVILSSIAALDEAQLLSVEGFLELITFRRPGPTTSLASVIAYFAVGLLFLAEAAYVRRRTAWQVERLEPPKSVGAGWVGQAAIGVVVVILVALALPTSYTLTLSQIVGIIVEAAMVAMQLVVGLIFLVLTTILYPLTLLFAHGGDQGSSAPPAMPTPAPAPPATPVPWLDVLQSLIFWLIALGVVAYVASVIWKRRPPMPAWLGASILGRIWAGLAKLLGSLRRAGAATARRVVAALPRIRPRPAAPLARAFRFISLRRLGPREMIEYFYLSVVERATRLGFGRESGETAAEYSRRLPGRFPDSEPDLNELTDAFLEARYGPRQVDDGLVSHARAHWQALKLKLRARRVGGPRA